MRSETLTAEQRALLDQLISQRGGTAAAGRISSAGPDRSQLPLSSSQQRIWFFDRLQPEAVIYNVAGAARLRGRIDPGLLRRCLGEIVERHEILRTTYHATDAGPVQRVNPPAEQDLALEDLSGLPAADRDAAAAGFCAREARRPFDLTRGPLLRSTLVRLSEEEHLLLVCQHHIATDGWSLNVLMRELGERYAAGVTRRPVDLPELPIQYGDYARWQRDWLSGAGMISQLEYWRGRLADSKLVDLATGLRRPTSLGWEGGTLRHAIGADVIGPVNAVAGEERATLYMALVAAQSVVLSRWSGQHDVIIGCPVANRKQAELEHLIGCFINEVPLRVETSGNPTFRELLRQVRDVALGAYENQEAPFERVVEAVNPERDAIAHAPLVRHQLGLHNEPSWRVELPGVTFEIAELSTDTARFDLEVDLSPDGAGGVRGTVYYSTDLFTADVVRRLLGSLTAVLQEAGRDPDAHIDEFPVVGTAERDRLGEAGTARTVIADTLTAHAGGGTVGELLAAALHSPDQPAVSGPDGTLTQGELDQLANRISGLLNAQGVQPGQPVAVCLPPSARLVAALLGVVRAGAAAVPMHPGYPVADLNDVLLDCSAGLILTDGLEPDGIDPLVRSLNVRDDNALAGYDPERPARSAAADQAAVICYSAPAGGTARGVVNSHAGVVQRLTWAATAFPLAPGERVVNTVTSFDLAPWELLGIPAAGGHLVLPGSAAATEVARLVRTERAGTLRCTPSTLDAVLDELARRDSGMIALSRVVTSGERPWPDLARRLTAVAPGAALFQQSGLPAAAADIVAQPVADDYRAGTYSFTGDVLPGPVVRVLDPRGALVPIGPAGELCVGGITPPSGFLGRPREDGALLTADPLAPPGRGGERLVRTGQRARWSPDGGLDLLGPPTRRRKHLVERSDVATCLESRPEVARASITMLADDRGAPDADAGLVAHLTLRADDAGSVTPGQDRRLFSEIWTNRNSENDPTLNPEGWNSPHTGEYLTAAEMREWADASLRRILALRPANVLEIGCKTGALLFRLAPRCETYTGTDLSARALAHIRDHQDWLATKSDDVTLLEVAADDFTNFRPGQFDVIVVNSVVQYFPDQAYLERVLRGALSALAPGGHIYLGGVRSLPLLGALHLPAVLSRMSPDGRAAMLGQATADRAEREEELAIDPAFFAALAGRLPSPAEVYLLPCLGRSRNELTGFRYDVVLRVGEPTRIAEPDASWRHAHWRNDGLSPDSVAATLADERPPRLMLHGVPDARVSGRLGVLRRLTAGEFSTVADVAAAMMPEPGRPGGPVDPANLASVAAAAGYRVLPQYATDDAVGSLDVLLTRNAEDSAASLTAADAYPAGASRPVIPATGEDRPLANRPLRAARARAIVPLLRGHLQESLPGYAVPDHLLVLDRFPVGREGTLELTALPQPDLDAAAAEAKREPSTDIERALAKIWAESLGVDRIGVHDDFFALGGHSLLGAEVIERVRADYQVDVPLGRLFESPTIASVASYLDEQLSRPREELAPIRHHDRDALRHRRAERTARRGVANATREES